MRITRAALVKRVNRELACERRRLVACRRGSAERGQLGAYFLIDHHGDVLETHVSLPSLARRLGVMQDYETLDVES